MSTFDYDRPLKSANRLIERYGQLGAIRRPGNPSGPSWNPAPGVPIDAPARFVITDYSSRDIDGTRIQMADKKALVAPGSLSFAPTTEHNLVEADGTTWNIVAVETLRPAETTLLWTLQVRR